MKLNISKLRVNSGDRNSSIELLRIIIMHGVIILHYNNGEIGGTLLHANPGSINWFYLFFSENLFICAVDLFIMISAYYLTDSQNRKTIKVVELIIQVIVFREAFYVMSTLLNKEPLSLKEFLINLLPVNYFVILYGVLYIISPYINILLDHLSRDALKKFLVVVLLLFSVWPVTVDIIETLYDNQLNGLSSIGLYGNQSGYTIVNFIVVYLVGAYIRKNEHRESPIKLVGMVTALVGMMTFISMYEYSHIGKVIIWHYDNPFVILVSAMILLLFLQIDFKNKIINELAKGCFTCFLFHTPFVYHLNTEKAATSTIFYLIVHQFSVAIVLFMVSYIIYKIYAFCTKGLIKIITPLCDRVSLSVGSLEKGKN